MSDTNFMSYSDAETVVTGIADKYKTFKGTQAQWDALSLADKVKYSFADITDDYAGTGVVDAVTNGDMNPVTSNAVYDYIYDKEHDHVSYTVVSGDTNETVGNKLYALIDKTKLNSNSCLVYIYSSGDFISYPIDSWWTDTQVNFLGHAASFGSSNASIKAISVVCKSSRSTNKVLSFSTTAGSGSGTNASWAITDGSSASMGTITKVEVWYNGYHQ